MNVHQIMKPGDMEDDSILKRTRYPVQLWEQPHGNGKGFQVCIWVTDTTASENYLWAYRKSFVDANELFNKTCCLFPNLPPEV
jgi:hypothetical protein